MVRAIYRGYDTIMAYGLTQYDYGQVLQIDGVHIEDGTEIHFCQGKKAITNYVTENQTMIPDYMLQYDDSIDAYIYKCDIASGETLHKIILHIRRREKPGDYVTPEEPAYSRLIPTGGAPGQVLARGPTGYAWVDPEQGQEATELEIIKMMEELFGGEL